MAIPKKPTAIRQAKGAWGRPIRVKKPVNGNPDIDVKEVGQVDFRRSPRSGPDVAGDGQAVAKGVEGEADDQGQQSFGHGVKSVLLN